MQRFPKHLNHRLGKIKPVHKQIKDIEHIDKCKNKCRLCGHKILCNNIDNDEQPSITIPSTNEEYSFTWDYVQRPITICEEEDINESDN